jgi:hypothetical protein
MKILAVLPDRKHYQPLEVKKAGVFAWADRASPLMQIQAPIADPWEREWSILVARKKGASRPVRAAKQRIEYTQAILLRCFPQPTGDEIPATIERERWKGKLAHTVGETLFFAAVSPNEVQVLQDLLVTDIPQLAAAIAQVGNDPQQIEAVLRHYYNRMSLAWPKTQNWLMLSIYKR